MKKYWILAVAALAACNNETLVENAEVFPEKDVAIAFGTDINKLTRAENSDATGENGLEAYHKTFRVWGYKNVEVETGKLTSIEAFKGTDDATSVVTWKTSGVTEPFTAAGDWTYSPLRFWDKTAANYDFHAASPEDAGWVATKADNSELTVGALTFKKTGATVSGESLKFDYTAVADKKVTGQPDDAFAKDVDLMIAEDETILPPFSQDKRVDFHFSHILSRFNIGVKTTLTSPNVVVLKSLEVYNMNSKGDFDEATDLGTDVLSEGTIKRWGNLSSTYTFGYPNTEVSTADMTLTSDVTLNSKTAKPADYKLVYQGLVIPQTVKYQGDLKQNGSNAGSSSEPYVKIVYTLNGETFTTFYNLASIFSNVNAVVTDENGNPAVQLYGDAGYAFSTPSGLVLADGTAITCFGLYKDGQFYQSDMSAGLKPLYYDTTTSKFYTDDAFTIEYPAQVFIVLNDDNSHHKVLRSEVDGECDVNFCEGWQNNLWITISPDAILFDASVYEWATKENHEHTVE